jgi:UDP-N-acetylmuramyl tripeptide synthase
VNLKLTTYLWLLKPAKLCNLKKEKIYKSLKKIKDVSGRLELVRKFSNNIKVFIDYAHTPDALSKALQSLIHTVWKKYLFSFWLRWR